MGRTKRHILSLEMADPGWRAVYRTTDGVTARELAAWALVERLEEESHTHVGRVGLVVEHGDRIVFVDQAGEGETSFCGYAPPGADVRAFQPQDASPHDPTSLYVDIQDVCHTSRWFG